jgi:cytochrome c556
MAGRVDPAADALWDSVAIIVSAKGVEERRPHTAAQWKAVRLQALTLIEATDLLSMPGRRVGDTTAAPGPGELSAPEIQRRIDTSHEAFANFASALRVAGQQALAAIDAHDPQRLMDAGGVIDTACEACHMSYWYPMPPQPASGAKP